MKILFFIHDISHGAGTERVLTRLANDLTNMNIDISILSCQNGEESHFPIEKRIKLYSLQGEREKNALLRKINGIQKIRKLCKNQRFDFIICVDVSLMLYIPFIKKKNIKVIAWEHFSYYIVQSKIQKYARKYSIKHADAIVVLTKKDKENYIHNEKKIQPVVQIYNPILLNNKIIPIIKRKYVVLAVGRLEKEKGFDLLLEAWEIIEKKNFDWSLKIIGEGSQKDCLETIIREKKLYRAKICSYSNYIEEEYKEAGIFVCSSRYEGFGMVLIEAQNFGLPVISFNCPIGPSEIIENKVNGILVEKENIKQLAEQIMYLINHKELRELLAKNALISVKKFDNHLIAFKWKKMFDLLLE